MNSVLFTDIEVGRCNWTTRVFELLFNIEGTTKNVYKYFNFYPVICGLTSVVICFYFPDKCWSIKDLFNNFSPPCILTFQMSINKRFILLSYIFIATVKSRSISFLSKVLKVFFLWGWKIKMFLNKFQPNSYNDFSTKGCVAHATFFSLLKLPNYGLLYLLCLSRLECQA